MRWRLKSPVLPLFIQAFILAQIKENTKAPRHWPFCGEFTGTSEFTTQMASNGENVSIWWRHHDIGHSGHSWVYSFKIKGKRVIPASKTHLAFTILTLLAIVTFVAVLEISCYQNMDYHSGQKTFFLSSYVWKRRSHFIEPSMLCRVPYHEEYHYESKL